MGLNMWFFKKKTKEVFKFTHSIEYKTEYFEVGRTLIKYELLDGRKFNSWCYGNISHYVNVGSLPDKRPHFVGEPIIFNSLDIAKQSLSNFNTQYATIIVDDINNPSKSVSGQIVAVSRGKTESYKIAYIVAYLVENKD